MIEEKELITCSLKVEECLRNLGSLHKRWGSNLEEKAAVLGEMRATGAELRQALGDFTTEQLAAFHTDPNFIKKPGRADDQGFVDAAQGGKS
ncbi:MAG TPA: hypothetical protein VKX25_19525 [Bryobacteraceae bacterium]|jgi:hypothetical protein|nr:hypothetical protein [Bryobacteraceae bacterium]